MFSHTTSRNWYASALPDETCLQLHQWSLMNTQHHVANLVLNKPTWKPHLGIVQDDQGCRSFGSSGAFLVAAHSTKPSLSRVFGGCIQVFREREDAVVCDLDACVTDVSWNHVCKSWSAATDAKISWHIRISRDKLGYELDQLSVFRVNMNSMDCLYIHFFHPWLLRL